MKKTHYKSITITTGLICLMITAILLIALATKLAKGNAAYAKVVGVFLIIALACLSLNPATTILDRPKDKVPASYRKLILGIIIATGVIVLLWFIVLFATNPGLIIRYTVGKRFEYGSGKEYADVAAATTAAYAAKDQVAKYLLITQLSVCATIIVAYMNLIVTRRFILKSRMIPIQVALYIGAFLFYIWFFIFAASAHTLVNTTDYVSKNYVRVIVEPTGSMGFVVNPLGFTLAFSGLAIYVIARFSSIWAVRKFKNEGLYEESRLENKEEPKAVQEVKNEEVKPNTDANDVKARLQKLNDLHEQGLINDEDYEKKKKDIIDSL